MRKIRVEIRRWSMMAALLLAALICGGAALADGSKGRPGVPDAYRELIELSLQEKTGLVFFMNGQVLPAVVTKIIDGHTIEGRNQEYGRIVIRLGRVNAIAKN